MTLRCLLGCFHLSLQTLSLTLIGSFAYFLFIVWPLKALTLFTLPTQEGVSGATTSEDSSSNSASGSPSSTPDLAKRWVFSRNTHHSTQLQSNLFLRSHDTKIYTDITLYDYVLQPAYLSILLQPLKCRPAATWMTSSLRFNIQMLMFVLWLTEGLGCCSGLKTLQSCKMS